MAGVVVRVSQNGGKPEPVTELDLAKQERGHRFVRLLPGDRGMIYTVVSGGIDSFDEARIDVFDLDSTAY